MFARLLRIWLASSSVERDKCNAERLIYSEIAFPTHMEKKGMGYFIFLDERSLRFADILLDFYSAAFANLSRVQIDVILLSFPFGKLF